MADIPQFTTRPELAGTFGMVASTHWLASAAGMAVLEKGGNAFDAAAAAGFVLQVVEPHLSGPGGEVPVIGYDARRGETFVVCGQGTAPAKATPQAYRDLGLDLVPGSGLLAACVPGAFGAWLLLLREYGRLPLRDVLEYAIGYARDGYPLVPAISWGIASVAGLFREHWTSSAEVYLPGGGIPAPGSKFANPALAATYRRILTEAEAAGGDREAQLEAARQAWYEGFVADAITRFAQTEVMDVTGERHRGLLTGQDMSGWHARLEEPATYDYQGLTVCKTRPWGQGPVFLQQLALLSGFDLDELEPGGAEYIHTVTECAKLAFADREAWYGDPLPTYRSTNCSHRTTTTSAASSSTTPRQRTCDQAGQATENRSCRHSPPQRSEQQKTVVATACGGAVTPAWTRPPASRWGAPPMREHAAVTRATSTWPTGGGTLSPPRRAAAGCSPRRSSRTWASALAPGRRCSPSPPVCPPRWRRANGRAPR